MPWLSTPCRSAQDRTSAVASAFCSGMPQADRMALSCARWVSYDAGMTVSFARRAVLSNGPGRSGSGEAVHPRRSAAIERRLFRGRRVGGDALERIPELGVAARLLVRREVALEHAAVRAKGFDAGLDVLAPRRGEIFGGRRQVALVEVEAERGHPDAAELDVDIRTFGQFGDVLSPTGEDLLPVTGIGADAEHAADMIEDDRRVGESAGDVDRVRQLRMILPGFEAEAERGELRKSLAEFGVAHQMRRHRAGGEFLDCVVGVP